MAACGAQHLLGRPQRVAAPRSAHQRELGEIDAAGGQGRRVRQVRRREPYDAPARPGKRGERRQHEPELADACAPGEELGQRAGRPAAPGKLAIERIKAGGRGRCGGPNRSAAPHRVPLENLFQGFH